MSTSKSAFSRYRIIDKALRNPRRPYPSMDDLIAECRRELGYEPSVETIQKDIANMRASEPEGLGAPVQYNRLEKGYEYTDPNYSLLGVRLSRQDLDVIESALDIIQAVGHLRISEQFNHAIEKLRSTTIERRNAGPEVLPQIQTMAPPESRGFQHLMLMYKACRECIPVSFIYFSYRKRKFRSVLLHPFLVKEFDNRWYVIGYSEGHDAIRTFGFDRVSAPLLIKKEFKSSVTSVIKKYLHEMYGVYPIRGNTREKVKIYAGRLATDLFEAYPLHHSQIIEKDDYGHSCITFELIPTEELLSRFRSWGKEISLLQPEWLANIFDKNRI